MIVVRLQGTATTRPHRLLQQPEAHDGAQVTNCPVDSCLVREVGQADVVDLPGAHRVVQEPQRLFKTGQRVPAVHLVQVDGLHVQPAQRGVQGNRADARAIERSEGARLAGQLPGRPGTPVLSARAE